MIDILICDDDEKINNQLQQLIGSFTTQNGIALNVEFRNSEDAVISEDLYCDIAILDIEMPGTSGLKLAEFLKKKNNNTLIIILTSFMEYLDNAMKINVFRYLSKPIEQNRLFMNLSDAIECCQNAGKCIMVESEGETYKIRTNDILYIENLKHGSTIVSKGSTYKTNKKPDYWLHEINQPACFINCHKSYIVNLQNVINFGKEHIVFATESGEKYYSIVSQRRYKEFKQAFYDFVGHLK